MSNAFLSKRLRMRAVVTASILALTGAGAGVADPQQAENMGSPRSPIKHVIVIVGENRTFDHVFATYKPKKGETVDNLLSKKIINEDGTPGVNYAKAAQFSAIDTTKYSISPGGKAPYNQTTNKLQAPGTSYAPQVPYTNLYDPNTGAAVNGPGAVATLALAKQAEYGLDPSDLGLLLTGATGLPGGSPDSRIPNYLNLPNGPYPLSPKPGYDTYGGSPVHRFYQMWQQLDCDATKATHANPSGCQADLFPWVEMTIASGSNGSAPHALHEGDIAMGFYNVAKGDAHYFTELARKYTLADNYHQPVMGGTYPNSMVLAYADSLYYSDAKGDPAVPDHVLVPGSNPAVYLNQIEKVDPKGANNWYENDGYSGGSYTNCSDTSQPGVASIVGYLNAIHVKADCRPGAYYLLNNYNPPYIGSGATDPINNGPFTMTPVIKQRHIGDELSAKGISWAYFGERWNDFKTAPGLGSTYGAIDPPAYLYCSICNPFLYSASVMTDKASREEHNKDLTDFYDAIAADKLPAVSYVKSSTFADGHPSSSKFDIFEAFSKRIIEKVQANPKLWESTAILVTVDEGGGYYDSGYVQPVDFFGDGTRIPLLVVSKYSEGGHVSHQYSDHASVVKFIERNWGLGRLSEYSRDNLPNPRTDDDNPYVPTNRPAIGDLWSMFDFGKADRED